MARDKFQRVKTDEEEVDASMNEADDGIIRFRKAKTPFRTKLKWCVINLTIVLSTLGFLGTSYFGAYCPFERDVWTCAFGDIRATESIVVHSDPKVQVPEELSVFELWFQNLLNDGWTKGHQVSVMVEGKEILSLAGGTTPEGKPYSLGESQPILSAGQILETVGIALLAEKGLLDIEKPVAAYWPEFGVNGKENITTADILSHKALIGTGFSSYPTEEQWNNEDQLLQFLQNQTQLFAMNSKNTIATSFRGLFSGLYTSEICKRVDPKGRNLFQFVQDELSTKYGEDFKLSQTEASGLSDAPARTGWLGTEIQARFHVYAGLFPKHSPLRLTSAGLQSVRASMYNGYPFNKFVLPGEKLVEAKIPASMFVNSTSPFSRWPVLSLNAKSNAKTLARVMSDFVSGDLVAPEIRDAFVSRAETYRDVYFHKDISYSVGGFVEAVDFLGSATITNPDLKRLSGCKGAMFTHGIGLILTCPFDGSEGIQELTYSYLANTRHPNPSGELERGLRGLVGVIKSLSVEVVEEDVVDEGSVVDEVAHDEL